MFSIVGKNESWMQGNVSRLNNEKKPIKRSMGHADKTSLGTSVKIRNQIKNSKITFKNEQNEPSIHLFMEI
jgi:hypothetical protein